MGPPLVILGDEFVFHQLLELFIGVTPNIANSNLALLTVGLDDLHQFLSPFFRESRHGHSNGIARGRRVEAEIGVPNGLLDRGHHLLLPWADADGSRIHQRECRDLREWSGIAVVVNG